MHAALVTAPTFFLLAAAIAEPREIDVGVRGVPGLGPGQGGAGSQLPAAAAHWGVVLEGVAEGPEGNTFGKEELLHLATSNAPQRHGVK